MSECIVLTVVRHSWENFSPGRSRKMILDIRHEFVLCDAMREAKKKKFCVKKLLKVSYTSVCCYAHGCVHVCAGDVCWGRSSRQYVVAHEESSFDCWHHELQTRSLLEMLKPSFS